LLHARERLHRDGRLTALARDASLLEQFPAYQFLAERLQDTAFDFVTPDS
jgi:hypothetical protein